MQARKSLSVTTDFCLPRFLKNLRVWKLWGREFLSCPCYHNHCSGSLVWGHAWASLGAQCHPHHSLRGPASSTGCFWETTPLGPYFSKSCIPLPPSWCGGNLRFSFVALNIRLLSVLWIKDTQENVFINPGFCISKKSWPTSRNFSSCPATKFPWGKGTERRKEPIWKQRGTWEG